ncbi:MAG: sulfate/thiosulfate transport system substrate-binding protein [Frankiaceae bacterium]|nr:sulfate/thiosulfate transport system substrate-binding protein [Frankiaceae bacterium]
MLARRPAVLVLSAALLATGLAGCGGSSEASGGGPKVTLSLVAYSTPQTAYEKIIKAFQKTAAGKNVVFTQSYGASGDQSRAVAAGLNADVVAFSLEPDVTRLVKADLVAADWNAGANKGIVTDSVVVIATRKGNPKHLSDWTDLTRKGIEVITPNPFTSGGARWNVMAAYGATSSVGAQRATGLAYLNTLFHQVPVQDDSARKSLQTFIGGKGDAMLAYENEAVFAQQKHQPLDYTVPDKTILIENPVAVTKTSKHPAEAKAFLEFLFTTTAQRIFADNGYRPVVQGVAKSGEFPAPSGLFTIADLGGWKDVSTTFFDPKTGLLVAVENDLGVPTEKK